jgi:hypothetical protein
MPNIYQKCLATSWETHDHSAAWYMGVPRSMLQEANPCLAMLMTGIRQSWTSKHSDQSFGQLQMHVCPVDGERGVPLERGSSLRFLELDAAVRPGQGRNARLRTVKTRPGDSVRCVEKLAMFVWGIDRRFGLVESPRPSPISSETYNSTRRQQ